MTKNYEKLFAKECEIEHSKLTIHCFVLKKFEIGKNIHSNEMM